MNRAAIPNRLSRPSVISLFAEFMDDWVPFNRALGRERADVSASQQSALWSIWLAHAP